MCHKSALTRCCAKGRLGSLLASSCHMGVSQEYFQEWKERTRQGKIETVILTGFNEKMTERLVMVFMSLDLFDFIGFVTSLFRSF